MTVFTLIDHITISNFVPAFFCCEVEHLSNVRVMYVLNIDVSTARASITCSIKLVIFIVGISAHNGMCGSTKIELPQKF